MTQEDKELLLKDLCARLPYRTMVKCITDYHHKFDEELSDIHIMNFYQFDVKPYLRPMSSMTEEEKEEIKPLFSKFIDEFGKRVLVVRQNKMALYQDWLNAHHFDHRTDNEGKTMIEKGLALEAKEGMYDN